jgi:hypothetical protein
LSVEFPHPSVPLQRFSLHIYIYILLLQLFYFCDKRITFFLMLVPCTAATSDLLYQPQKIGEGECGAICAMKIGRGNRRTRRKPAPAPLCPPQIPFDQTGVRTRTATVTFKHTFNLFCRIPLKEINKQKPKEMDG